MIDIVDKTINHWRKTSFKWGAEDCLLSLANYLVECGYEDYGVPFRHNYNDEIGASYFIKLYGGEDQIINTTGLSFTDEPVRGDIVLADIKGLKASGLCTDKNIAFRTTRGVVEVKMSFLKIIKSWKVNKCHQ